jgi:hypothetical protein
VVLVVFKVDELRVEAGVFKPLVALLKMRIMRRDLSVSTSSFVPESALKPNVLNDWSLYPSFVSSALNAFDPFCIRVEQVNDLSSVLHHVRFSLLQE